MQRNTAVVSVSLPPEVFAILNQLAKAKVKTKSEVIKDLLLSCRQNESWEKIFAWGRQTKEKYRIASEEDILKIIND